jgi:hypothetical protein
MATDFLGLGSAGDEGVDGMHSRKRRDHERCYAGTVDDDGGPCLLYDYIAQP